MNYISVEFDKNVKLTDTLITQIKHRQCRYLVSVEYDNDIVMKQIQSNDDNNIICWLFLNDEYSWDWCGLTGRDKPGGGRVVPG